MLQYLPLSMHCTHTHLFFSNYLDIFFGIFALYNVALTIPVGVKLQQTTTKKNVKEFLHNIFISLCACISTFILIQLDTCFLVAYYYYYYHYIITANFHELHRSTNKNKTWILCCIWCHLHVRSKSWQECKRQTDRTHF